MDTKRETCDIRTWKKHLFLDISSTNTDTLVPSLYQCVGTRSIEEFWLLSQPLTHIRFNLFVISGTFATKTELLYATNTSHRKLEIFLYEYRLQGVLLRTHTDTQKSRTKRCSSVVYSSSTAAIFTTETSLWTCACESATQTVMKPDCAATWWYT
jgi:hypothetical protein